MSIQKQDDVSAEAVRLRSFWDARYKDFSLRESGILQHSAKCSELLYACKSAAYRRALRDGSIDVRKPTKILDVGCGQGFFARLAKKIFTNPRYTGIDISEKAIEYLKAEIPEFEWHRSDASSPNFQRFEPFDLIQSIEVLHLILDDRCQTQAIQNLANTLSDNGILILTDTLPEKRTQVGEYIVFRPWTYYKALFDSLSLERVSLRPMYYWMPDGGPHVRVLRRCVRMLPLTMIYWLDRILLRLRVPQWKQSHDCKMKMIVCRKLPR